MDRSNHKDNDASDTDVNELQHSNLLASVSQLDLKQRVKPPSRKESSYQISEFHLVKKDTNKDAIKISNLTKLLGQRGSHAAIGKHLRSFQHKAITLPRPLEKPVAAKIQRTVGFKNVKVELGRWNAVVYSNRAADQLSFPLKQSRVDFETSSDSIAKWKSQKKTPLEAQMDEILNSSPIAQEDRKKEEEFQMTLAELREHRREMAKLRAQQSYMASKARRQNKIKSKKYHRIMRRERIRQQLKDFEMLQKTDPEAALQQLEQLERTRAEERVSLRHRSTGQWARNKAVRAKYDKESRQELAQQLSMSRDLTQKIQTGNSSDDEGYEEQNEKIIHNNNGNPWITPKTASEVEEFLTGYRKYWEKQNNRPSVQTINTEIMANHQQKNEVDDIANGMEKEIVESKEVANKNNNSGTDNEDSADCVISLSKRNRHKSGMSNPELLKLKDKSNELNNHKTKRSESSTSIIATSNAWLVTPIEETVKENKNSVKVKKDRMRNINPTKGFQVNKLFNDMEEMLKEKVSKKLKKLKSELKVKDKNVKFTDSESDNEGPSLEMKQSKLRPDWDEELIEQPRNRLEDDETSENNINLNLRIAQTKITEQEEETSNNNIDPNKFIEIKTTHLQTELPNIITEGDEVIDDNDDQREERQMTISEAFADDDIIADFRKEKEEIEEKSQSQEIDLSLPGWGEWGGKNLQVSARKKRRFVIKFPKVAPRKDANKGSIIINEERNDKVKVHQVNELPFPFTSVKDFEASIRAPIGNTWIPETAHHRLTKPSVVTKLGTVIQPMDEDSLVNKKKIIGMQ